MIIGDSSALVALSIMDRLDLLESIFGKVYVPQAVYDEVTISYKPQSLKLKNYLKDKIVTVSLSSKPSVNFYFSFTSVLTFIMER